MTSRECALFVLNGVSQGGYLSACLDAAMRKGSFDGQDKSFIARLCYETLHHQITIDAVLDQLTGRIGTFERLVLRLAVCQLWYFDRVPAYAAVAEAVAEGKKKGGQKTANFINAVLRHCPDRPPVFDDLSLDYSHPAWLVKMWQKQYGEKETLAILKADQSRPAYGARVNTLQTTREKVLKAYPDLQEGKLSPDAVLFPRGSVASHPLYQNGDITIQDQASQLAAIFSMVQENDRVLDLCAGAGGKSTHLAAIMHNTGSILALDIYTDKLNRLLDNARRLGCLNITTRLLDGTRADEVLKPEYDLVMVDAPCSGLGDLARKPEIRYREPERIDDLIALQRQLLLAASKLVKPRGLLVYCTCTLNKKENEGQTASIQNEAGLDLEYERTVFPQGGQHDGFYLARMRKS